VHFSFAILEKTYAESIGMKFALIPARHFGDIDKNVLAA
jgi:hypothetical protein